MEAQEPPHAEPSGTDDLQPIQAAKTTAEPCENSASDGQGQDQTLIDLEQPKLDPEAQNEPVADPDPEDHGAPSEPQQQEAEDAKSNEVPQTESIALDKPKRQRKKKEPKDYDTITGSSTLSTSPARARTKSPCGSPGRASNHSPGRSSTAHSPGHSSTTHSPGRSPGRSSAGNSPRRGGGRSPGRSGAGHSPGRGSSSPGRTQSPGRSKSRSPGSGPQSPARATAAYKESDAAGKPVPKGKKTVSKRAQTSRKRKLPVENEPVPRPGGRKIKKAAAKKQPNSAKTQKEKDIPEEEPKKKKSKKIMKGNARNTGEQMCNGPATFEREPAVTQSKLKGKRIQKKNLRSPESGLIDSRERKDSAKDHSLSIGNDEVKKKKPVAKRKLKNPKIKQKEDPSTCTDSQPQTEGAVPNSTEDAQATPKSKTPRKKKVQEKQDDQLPAKKVKKATKKSVKNNARDRVQGAPVNKSMAGSGGDNPSVEPADLPLPAAPVKAECFIKKETFSGTMDTDTTGNESSQTVKGDERVVDAGSHKDITADDSQNRVFQCAKCSYRAKKKVSLRRHMTVHGVFECAHCEFVADKNDLYEVHMKEKHPSRCGRKLCKKCNVLFQTDEIEIHEQECDGEKKKWTCSECRKEFKFLCAMRSHHEKWHSELGKTCDKCGFVANSHFGLRKHDLTVHRNMRKVKEKPAVQCTKCDKAFSSDNSARQHMRIHEDQEHPCPKCAKIFKTPRSLQNHTKVHEATKVIPCEVEGCTKVFKNQKVMEIHKNRCHDKEPKRFKCNYANCEQKFYTKYHLKRHEIMHTGERNYKCTYPDCPKAFHHAENLRVHLRSHNNIRCPLCRRTFKEEASLQLHLPVHKNAKSQKKAKRSRKPATDGEGPASQGTKAQSASDGSQVVSEVKVDDATSNPDMSAAGDVEVLIKPESGPHDVYDFDSDDEKVDISSISMRPSPTKTPRFKPGNDVLGTLPLHGLSNSMLDTDKLEGKKKKKSKKKKDKIITNETEGKEKSKSKKKRSSKKKNSELETTSDGNTGDGSSLEGVEKTKKSKKKSDKKHKGEKTKDKKKKGDKHGDSKDQVKEKTKKKKSSKKKEGNTDREGKETSAKLHDAADGKKKKSKKKKAKKQKPEETLKNDEAEEHSSHTNCPAEENEDVVENCHQAAQLEVPEELSLPVNSVVAQPGSPPPSPTPDYLDDRKHGFFSPRPEQTRFASPITTPAYRKQVGYDVGPMMIQCKTEQPVEELPCTNENDSGVLESPVSEMTEAEVNELDLPAVPGASPGDGPDDNDGHSDFVEALSPTIKDINGQNDEMLNDIAKQVEAENAIGDADVMDDMSPSNYNSSIHTTPSSVQPPLSVQPPSVAPASVPPPQEVPVITSHTTHDRLLEEQGIGPMLSRYEGETAARDIYQHPPLSNSSTSQQQQQHQYLVDQQPQTVSNRSHSLDFALHEAPLSVHSQPPCLTEEQARTPRSDTPPSLATANKYYMDNTYPPSVYHSHRVPSVPPADSHMVPDVPHTPSSVPSEPSSRFSDSMSHNSGLYRQDSQGCAPYSRDPMPPSSTPNYSSPPQNTYLDPHTPGLVNNKEDVSLPTTGVPERSSDPMYLPSRSTEEPTSATDTGNTQNLPVSTCPSSTPATFSTDSLPRDLFGQYFQDPTGSMPLTHPPISQDQRIPSYPSGQQQTSLPTLSGTNSDYFRRSTAPFMPGSGYPSVTESLVPPPPQHWMSSQDERSRHWGQPSPILPIPSELDSANPLTRNPYSRPSEYSYNTTSSSQFSKQTESTYPNVPQTIANTTERPTYDMASAYMNSRTFNPNYSGTMPPPPASTSTQKQLEEVYRRAAHITDYRTLSQAAPPSMADMYSRMAVPGLGLDKYYYPRDAMFRSQHLSGPPHPFMPQTNSAQMAYSERDYSRNPIYSQHSAYGFMGEKQYLTSNKLPPSLPGLQERPVPSEYLQSPAAAAAAMGDPHIQDPYRRSVIYNMMSRYF